MNRVRRLSLTAALALAAAAVAANAAPRGGGSSGAAAATPPAVGYAIAGKPAPPIAIDYALAQAPALGRPLAIDIAVSSSFALDDVVVSLIAGDGLSLGPAQALHRIARIDAGSAYAIEIVVTPLVVDVLYLTVVVEADAGNERQARTALIPVRLAAVKSRVPATLKADPAGGGLVHSLPAVQSPSSRLR